MADIGNKKVSDLLKQNGQTVFTPTVTPMSQTNPVNKNNNPTGVNKNTNPLDLLGVNQALGLDSNKSAQYTKEAYNTFKDQSQLAADSFRNGNFNNGIGALAGAVVPAPTNLVGGVAMDIGSGTVDAVKGFSNAVGRGVNDLYRGVRGLPAQQPNAPVGQLTYEQLQAMGKLPKDSPITSSSPSPASVAPASPTQADYDLRRQNTMDYINALNKQKQGVLGTALGKAQPTQFETVQYQGNPQAELADRHQRELNVRLNTVDQQMANAMKTLQGITYVDYAGEVRTKLPSNNEMVQAKTIYDTLSNYRNTLLGQSGAVGQTAQNAQINSDSLNQRAGIEDKQMNQKAGLEAQLAGVKANLDPNVQNANMKNTWMMNLVQNMNKLNSLPKDSPEYAETYAKQQQYQTLLGLNKQENEFKTANYEETQYDPVTGAAKSKKSIPVIATNNGFKGAYNPNGTQSFTPEMISQASSAIDAMPGDEKQKLGHYQNLFKMLSQNGALK